MCNRYCLRALASDDSDYLHTHFRRLPTFSGRTTLGALPGPCCIERHRVDLWLSSPDRRGRFFEIAMCWGCTAAQESCGFPTFFFSAREPCTYLDFRSRVPPFFVRARGLFPIESTCELTMCLTAPQVKLNMGANSEHSRCSSLVRSARVALNIVLERLTDGPARRVC